MKTQLSMKPLTTTMIQVMVLILILVLKPGLGAEKCPTEPRCYCKWLSGKRLADCKNAGFENIPENLNPETQILILDNNHLGHLEKDAFKSAGLLNLQKLELKSCHIEVIHEHAFRDLKILMEVDIR